MILIPPLTSCSSSTSLFIHFFLLPLLVSLVVPPLVPPPAPPLPLVLQSQAFGGSINLLNTFGYSVVTFDGRPSSAVVPRTSSNSFHFEPQDERTVTELRAWAATQGLVPTAPSVRLSGVQPQSYFDLTCQLLWKAPVDTTCTLLKVGHLDP